MDTILSGILFFIIHVFIIAFIYTINTGALPCVCINYYLNVHNINKRQQKQSNNQTTKRLRVSVKVLVYFHIHTSFSLSSFVVVVVVSVNVYYSQTYERSRHTHTQYIHTYIAIWLSYTRCTAHICISKQALLTQKRKHTHTHRCDYSSIVAAK